MTSGKAHGSWITSQAQCKHKKLGPFIKKCNFGHIWLLENLQKLSSLTRHISFNFDPTRVLLDFLEILGCPLSNLFVLISIESSILILWSFDPKGVFVDFSKWPIMSKLITSCECIFWTWDMKFNCRSLHPLQNEIWMGHSW